MRHAVLVEASPFFDRWDIVDRVLEAAAHTGLDIDVLVVRDRIIVRKRGNSFSKTKVSDTYKALMESLSLCGKIIVLSENSWERLEPGILRGDTCVLMGLHSDIPGYLLETLPRPYEERSLGGPSYLASQCIYILGYLATGPGEAWK